MDQDDVVIYDRQGYEALRDFLKQTQGPARPPGRVRDRHVLLPDHRRVIRTWPGTSTCSWSATRRSPRSRPTTRRKHATNAAISFAVARPPDHPGVVGQAPRRESSHDRPAHSSGVHRGRLGGCNGGWPATGPPGRPGHAGKALIAITLDLEMSRNFPEVGRHALGLREGQPGRRGQEVHDQGLPAGQSGRRGGPPVRRRPAVRAGGRRLAEGPGPRRPSDRQPHLRPRQRAGEKAGGHPVSFPAVPVADRGADRRAGDRREHPADDGGAQDPHWR